MIDRLCVVSLIAALLDSTGLFYLYSFDSVSAFLRPAAVHNLSGVDAWWVHTLSDIGRRRLHEVDRTKSCGGDAPKLPPREFCYVSFLNSKTSQFLHVVVWFNSFAVKLTKLYFAYIDSQNVQCSVTMQVAKGAVLNT